MDYILLTGLFQSKILIKMKQNISNCYKLFNFVVFLSLPGKSWEKYIYIVFNSQPFVP